MSQMKNLSDVSQTPRGTPKSIGKSIGITTRLAALVLALTACGIALTLGLSYAWPKRPLWAGFAAILIEAPLIWVIVRSQIRPMLSLFQAMSGTVISYQDGDYSFALRWPRDDEITELVAAHNALGNVLREQRLALVQRELLLDTMLQNTPLAMVLIADRGAIVFANIAARQLLHQGRRLEGHALDDILAHVAAPLRDALSSPGDRLFAIPVPDDAEQIYHLSRRVFTLNGRQHQLLMLRHMTRELRRQEVQTWKKVIRIISHELNNSLAPVASLARSASELVRRRQPDRLPDILRTIEERALHLESFIQGYARFAKLPAPQLDVVQWPGFIASLQSQFAFKLIGSSPVDSAHFDTAQMEQALLNILKNAHESGSALDQIEVAVRRHQDALRMEIMDRGSGMSEVVMANALVPFYSTKRSGTGLGLALAREIVEAHGGHIMLNNRDGGGLMVSLIIPN